MRFLDKNASSPIIEQGLIYKSGGKNSELRDALLNEQFNFCAYTERRIEFTHAVDVEHFDSSLKDTDIDGYTNWYAVLHKVNNSKFDVRFKGARFLEIGFWRDRKTLDSKIRYVAGDEHVYEAIDPDDNDAKDFIEFLRLNENGLRDQRKKYVERMKSDADILGSIDELISIDRERLSFPTALETELNRDFKEYYSLSR